MSVDDGAAQDFCLARKSCFIAHEHRDAYQNLSRIQHHWSYPGRTRQIKRLSSFATKAFDRSLPLRDKYLELSCLGSIDTFGFVAIDESGLRLRASLAAASITCVVVAEMAAYAGAVPW